MLNTVLVTTDFPPSLGGIQAVLYNTARHFTRVNVMVVAPSHADANAFDRQQPFEIRRVKPAGTGNRVTRALRVLRMGLESIRHLRRGAPAVLLCGHPFTAFVGLVVKRMLGVPFVVWTHGKEL